VTGALEIAGVKVCAVEDVPVGEGRAVTIDGRPLAVFRTGAGFFALDNACTHMGGPLADGIVADKTVACPLHDRRFQLATGRAVGHQCGGVIAYPVEERDGEVFVTMPLLPGNPD
jgi:nitrite reductase (NADH) small subunit